jgi:ParB family chromosome partitioning protein
MANTGLLLEKEGFRAAKIAGLKDVPVYIRETQSSQLLELALLENLQRENLNAIEIALSYKRLMDDLDYTQEQVAERMGKERSTVGNYIRLLKLPPDNPGSRKKQCDQYGACKGPDQCGYGR